MPKRVQLSDDSLPSGGKYFDNPTDLQCFSSGCTLLDCVLSGPRPKGGWALGRISNVVGDKSVGKSLLCIEATANFAREFPDKRKHKLRYREAESSFDDSYAASLGMDLKRVQRPDDVVDTVEGFFADLDGFVNNVPQDGAGLYVLDSLDALSDDAEMKEAFGKDSYGAKKAKLMGQLFRRMVRRIESRQIHVMIVSQLRDKIGTSFGEKQSRSGGRALDFYASQVIWLANLGMEQVTKGGVKRPVAINIRARCKKNKVAMPFRECDYPIMFAYGVEDVRAGVEWLASVKMLDRLNLTEKTAKKYLSDFATMSQANAGLRQAKVSEVVRKTWREIESRFLPTRSKYGQ